MELSDRSYSEKILGNRIWGKHQTFLSPYMTAGFHRYCSCETVGFQGYYEQWKEAWSRIFIKLTVLAAIQLIGFVFICLFFALFVLLCLNKHDLKFCQHLIY